MSSCSSHVSSYELIVVGTSKVIYGYTQGGVSKKCTQLDKIISINTAY